MILICLVFLLWQSYQKRVKTKLLVIFLFGFFTLKKPGLFPRSGLSVLYRQRV